MMEIKNDAKHHFVIRDDFEFDTTRVDDGEWDSMDNVVAVCGLQSSGGLAILDWLDDHGNVVGSRTENQISNDQQSAEIDQNNNISMSDDIASDLDDEIPF